MILWIYQLIAIPFFLLSLFSVFVAHVPIYSYRTGGPYTKSKGKLVEDFFVMSNFSTQHHLTEDDYMPFSFKMAKEVRMIKIPYSHRIDCLKAK